MLAILLETLPARRAQGPQDAQIVQEQLDAALGQLVATLSGHLFVIEQGNVMRPGSVDEFLGDLKKGYS